MPKRKCIPLEDGVGGILKKRKLEVDAQVTRSKKVLHRAFKTAKGFERQKLGKRLKLATTTGATADIIRINKEIEALKTLDLDQITHAHLCKAFLKVKAISENDLYPDELRKEIPRPGGDEEMLVAVLNVTSGMCNMKIVKDTVSQALTWMYIALGIPVPVERSKHARRETEKLLSKATTGEDQSKVLEKGMPPKVAGSGEGPVWEGFDSGSDIGSDQEEGLDSKKSDAGESMDDEEISRYDALLGASSDEESFDEQEYLSKRPAKSNARLSLSLSPSPTSSPTLSISPTMPALLEQETKHKAKLAKAKNPKPDAVKVAGSTFLPTLMGGYWSGSEESASDIEDAARPPRKNRPGQMARRAIWEKKFGQKANHVKNGQPLKGKDDGWDPKRGAKDSGRGRGYGPHGERQSEARRSFDRGTGENSTPVQPRKRGLGKKDDAGVLHPSWQAAKKAKELKQTATFQGKKVTF